MSTEDQATFACGMPNPWTPWNPRPWEAPGVVAQPIRCDHCFCKESRSSSGEGPHLQCCKCMTTMAEKFVTAWFSILSPERKET